jgi:branched-chain amino acid transport system substrate-binding protein
MYKKAIDAYDPDGETSRNDLSINGWASVWALQQIASDLPDVTRKSVLKAMGEVKDLDLGGIYPPLSAPDREGNPPGLGCAMAIGNVLMKVEDGETFAAKPGEFFEPFAD